MSVEDVKGIYSLKVEDFDADYKGRLSFGVLGRHLLNYSNLHAFQNGVGCGVYSGTPYTWVISRLVVEFAKPLCKSEGFSLQTWMSRAYHSFLDREYLFLDEDMKTVGKGHAVWAMIDEVTRKSVNMLQFHGQQLEQRICNESLNLTFTKERIKLNECKPCFEHRVVYGDLDINGHVNSIRYIEHALNLFSLDIFERSELYKFEIAYAAEASYGDNLLFYKTSIGEESYYVEIRQKTNEVVCKCYFYFR